MYQDAGSLFKNEITIWLKEMFEHAKIWMRSPENGRLVTPYEIYSDLIKEAQAFTVALKAFVVSDQLDINSDNDILILTQTSLGNRPVVERVHFWQKDVKPGDLQTNMFAENVFLENDYSGEERLHIRWIVMEIDTADNERQETINYLVETSRKFSSAFPIFASYAGVGSLVVQTIQKLFDTLRKDTKVINLSFSLYPTEDEPGYLSAPLQKGSYAIFDRNIYGDAYKLDERGTVWHESGRRVTDINRFRDGSDPLSYIVFTIEPRKLISPDKLNGQKIATLLSQIRDKENRNTAQSALDFLEETVEGYEQIKLLKRFYQLKRKSRRTAEEETLMQEILDDIEGNSELSQFLF